jgi:hypothetical protein
VRSRLGRKTSNRASDFSEKTGDSFLLLLMEAVLQIRVRTSSAGSELAKNAEGGLAPGCLLVGENASILKPGACLGMGRLQRRNIGPVTTKWDRKLTLSHAGRSFTVGSSDGGTCP